MVDAPQAAKLKARIGPGTWPSHGTPLAATIAGQAAALRAWQPAAPLAPGGKRVLVLMTDGVPNGSSTKQAVIDEVRAARSGSSPVETFVVGIGDPGADEASVYDERFLSTLAAEGGASAPGCDPAWDREQPGAAPPCHLQVTPGTKSAAQIGAAIGGAIDAIAETVRSCEFSLDRTSDIDPSRVNVVYRSGAGAESQLPADASNGWAYDQPNDPTKVIVYGAACDALKRDPAGSLRVVIGCRTGTNVR